MNFTSKLEPLSLATSTALVGGCHEISFNPEEAAPVSSPLPLIVSYTLPSGLVKTTRGFVTATGDVKARCYVSQEGTWQWEVKNQEGRCIRVGNFQALGSPLPGKIKSSDRDPRHLQYANGSWFLQIGDNAHRFPVRDETKWEAYLVQAAQAGFNKLRVWLPNDRHSAACLFDGQRKSINFEYWDEIDRRFTQALIRYPEIQLQVCPFAEDADEFTRFGEGDPVSYLALRYAQERFSAFPNIHWCVAHNLDTSDENAVKIAKEMGAYLASNDLWDSLVTCHQKRFTGFDLFDEEWCAYAAISDLGQANGSAIHRLRPTASKPIFLEEDRNEGDLKPNWPRYYFRRLFWGALLSGGYPSYQGLDTSSPHKQHSAGIQGYYDLCHAGDLRQGAQDLHHVRKFFEDTGITLEKWTPDDILSGNDPLKVKSAKSQSGTEVIAYIANPEVFGGHAPDGFDGVHTDKLSDASETFTTFTLELPFSSGTAKWYNPTTGEWKGEAEITKNSTTLLTPAPGDWIVHVTRK
ncbi:MAG: DUF4038 domain-containing protein [Verrucomicrobiota bacterium]